MQEWETLLLDHLRKLKNIVDQRKITLDTAKELYDIEWYQDASIRLEGISSEIARFVALLRKLGIEETKFLPIINPNNL